MKLEFDANTSAATIAENDFLCQTDAAKSQIDLTELLNEGVKAAQSGRRAEARSFLLTVTESDPENEAAWLWLASISEYPEELVGFLNNVLRTNPENERALTWRNETKSLLSKTFVQRGIDASKENRKDFAKQCFRQALLHNEQSDMAWLWMAACADSDEEKTEYLQKVLEIDPENETANASLRSMKQQSAQTLLQQAFASASDGENDSSLELLQEVLSLDAELEEAWMLKSCLAQSFAEKLECFEKVLELNPENKLAAANMEFLRGMNSKDEAGDEPSEAGAEEVAEFAEDASGDADFAAQVEEDFVEDKFPTDELKFPEEMVAEDRVFESEQMPEAEFEEVAEESEAVIADLEAEEMEENSAEFAQSEPEYSENFEAEDLFENENVADEFEAAEDSSPVSDFEEQEAAEFFAAEESMVESFEESFDDSPEMVIQPKDEPAESFDAAQAADSDEFETARLFQSETILCPFCDAENESQTFVCGPCGAVYSLSDLEMLLAPRNADHEIIGSAVREAEAEISLRDFDADELKFLAVGYFNLDNPQKGLLYLKEAAKLDPDDILLASQVNALKIRLSEIEKQQSNHDSMPKNMTILIADDSATVRKLISGKLEKCGHTVVCAVDGVDALEKLGEIAPDLILLDINMPRMDGYQACKLIRGNETTKDVPVVMISGKDGFFDKVRGRMAGTTGYITKPFGPETLMKTVETYIAQPA